jgi:hypothetical protein
MTMKKLIFPLLLALLASCSAEKTKQARVEKPAGETLEGMKAGIGALEDSLSNGTLQMDKDCRTGVRYAEKCIALAQKFPASKEAPVYLDRAHMIFSGCGLNRRSVEVAEGLVKKYPLYPNRPMVLESLAAAYDISIVPRDKNKVKYYYGLLLKENPGMPEERRKEIGLRLDNIDLTFEEMISGKAAKTPAN